MIEDVIFLLKQQIVKVISDLLSGMYQGHAPKSTFFYTNFP
jgi:hypothetical protein